MAICHILQLPEPSCPLQHGQGVPGGPEGAEGGAHDEYDELTAQRAEVLAALEIAKREGV